MTKEKIIKIVNACVQYNANQGTWSIDNRFADELLALIEQEKDDLLKEFVEFAKGEFIKANYCYNDTYLDTMLEMFLEKKK